MPQQPRLLRVTDTEIVTLNSTCFPSQLQKEVTTTTVVRSRFTDHRRAPTGFWFSSPARVVLHGKYGVLSLQNLRGFGLFRLLV